MQKIKNTFMRIRSISLGRLFLCVGLVKKESGKAGIRIFLDMVFCYLRYGIGYLDYLTFGFIYQDKAHRKTFMTMNQNLALVRRLNPVEMRDLFDNKLEFNKRFSKELGRGYLNLETANETEFRTFLNDKRVVFAKQVDQFGGKGIERIEIEREPDKGALFGQLKLNRQFDIEEEIVQHPDMNRLSDSSINSLRMTTIEKDGEVFLLYTLVRMSDGSSFVDNISSGGMYCPVGENGKITAAAFCDKTGEYYDVHPKSGTEFIGFEIPFYPEAEQLVKRSATRFPKIRYVGWDVAITKNGPVLIEGNVIPGYDMCQNYRHLGPDKVGILPKMKAILKEEFIGI